MLQQLFLLAFVCSFFVSFGSCQNATSVPSLLTVAGWQAEPLCNTTAAECCCFTNSVNIYVSATNELFINGSVAGGKCKRAVEQDNLDPPSSYSFAGEFFGIDDYTFNVTNATYNGVFGYQIAATSNEHPRCDFTLFHASASGLPTPVTPTPAPPPVLPTFAVPFVSSAWSFTTDTTNTCAASSACCCLTGTGTIVQKPDGTQLFDTTATPSAGCLLPAGQMETDDFPWPTQGTLSSSTTNVSGFLVNQDNYEITLTLVSASNQYQLYFQDLTNPTCSMQAFRSANAPTATPTTTPSAAAAPAASFYLAAFIAITVMTLLLKTSSA